MKKEVLLTHSFLLHFDPKQERTGQAYAPLGTLYAASMLRKHGIEFRFYDPMFSHSPDDIIPVMKECGQGILVIYDDGFNYLSKMCLDSMRAAAFRIADAAKLQGMKVVIWSVDAMDNAEVYLDHGVDVCILGEGEQTLADLLLTMTGKVDKELRNIPGITWKTGDTIQVSTPREIMTDPDEIPFPAWDLLDMAKYRQAWKSRDRKFTLNMVTTRGCPYGCIWCAKPVYGNRYHSRSAENVVREIQYLHDNYHPESLWFADDIFGLKPGWIAEFSALLKASDLKPDYTIQSRVDLLLEDDQVNPLAESGCSRIWLGIESGSQRILDAMHKGTTIGQTRIASAKIRNAGIRQAFFLQLGFPGEEKGDIRKTINLLSELMPDDIGISVTYPLPGTPFYEAVKDNIRDKKHWSDSDDLAILFKSSYSPSYYRYLHRFIHKYYRFRQGIFVFRKILAGNLKPEKSNLRRIVLMPYYLLFAMYYWVFKQIAGNVRS